MSYRIDVTREARGEIKALPGYVRRLALKLVRGRGLDPRPARARELCPDPQVYRIWLAGRWRVAYAVDDQARALHVLRVRRRSLLDYEGLDSSDYIPQATDGQGYSLPAAPRKSSLTA